MKTLQDFSIPGLQTVEGQNYSFNAASKGYKRYQMMHYKQILPLLCSTMCASRNNVEKVTVDVGGNTESVFTSWKCKYEVKRRLQKRELQLNEFTR